MKSLADMGIDKKSNYSNKEQLSDEEIKRELDKEYVHDDSVNDNVIFHKAPFVGILNDYCKAKTKIKISSFTHKNVSCVVINSNARYVIIKSLLTNKKMYLLQTSIKDIEEI